MTELDKYLSLKKRVEANQQKADQAEGAFSEVMKQLKHEFGCSTLDQAKKELKRRRVKAADSKEKFNAALEKFEEDWPDESN